MAELSDPLNAFIEAACAPRDASHASGTLDQAQAILAAHPELATSSIHAAAILGDAAGVTRFLQEDRVNATAKGGPHGWDALTHLCFSRYLRIDRARSDGFIRAARALLDAGASANTGWFENDHEPKPEWESAIYGAAGVAHDAGLTRLLLERGADPNDGETPYHTPETYENDALKVLVESGKLNANSLALMLLRKADWHDHDGIVYLLDRGVDPNQMTQFGNSALHHAIRRDNWVKNIEAMLDRGGDPTIANRSDGRTAVEMAARRGRGDVLELFERRGFATALQGVAKLIAACARNDSATVHAIVAGGPLVVGQLVAEGGTLLAEFAGVGNRDGVAHLLDLGVDVNARYQEGDGYFGIAKDSLAIHVAAWRANHDTVKLLIERGSAVDVPDRRGRTPLALAVRACVDSYWTYKRSPASVEALLRAGASGTAIDFPSGYAEVHELLEKARSGCGPPSVLENPHDNR